MSLYDIAPSAGSGLASAASAAALVVFDIPDCDYDEWRRDVPRAERARVRELFKCFREMSRARTLDSGALSAAMSRAHFGWGWSAKALLNLYRVYTHGGHKPGDHKKTGAIYPAGDWRVLLRSYKGFEPVLPAEFTRWLCEQWAQFRGRKDCVNALWRHVVYELWLQGAPVPGYGAIDDWCRRAGRARPHPQFVRPSELPDGWSERTFRRQLPSRKSVTEQIAHGYLAAHQYQPDQVLTDRGPLLPLQFVFLDDSRPDFRCLYLNGGRGEIVYPLLVLGLDAASAVDVANCAKPRALKSPEAEDALERKARHGVTQDMALQIVVNTLRRFGLPPWKVTFVHENAAACVPPEARRLLEEIYGDRVGFEATGTVKQQLVEHGFTEGGGAPYDKAPIEAFWRILMTQLANRPGATGPRYDTQPPELKNVEKYTLETIDRAHGVEEIIAQLDVPLLRFEAAHAAIERALQLLRFRIKHKLQGFDRVQEFRRSPAHGYEPIEALLALSIDEQNAIATNGDRDAILSRLECPAERFCRLLRGVEMTPVDDDLLVYLEGPRFPVTVRNGKITIDRAALGDDLAIFREEDHPLLAPECEGRTFEAALPRDGGRIVLTTEGRILGSVARQGRVVRGTDDWRREMGRVAAARKADRELLAGYMLTDTATALLEMRERNEAVLAQVPQLAAAAPARDAGAKPARLTADARRRNSNRAAQLAAAARANLPVSSEI